MLGRERFQRFYEILFRNLIVHFGYMNFSEDYKSTGGRKLIEKLGKLKIATALDIGA